MNNRLIFFGNERLATAVTTTAPVLRKLIENKYQIEAVITSHQDPLSRQKHDLEIGELAHRHNIPVILLGDKLDLIEKVRKHKADFAVLAAFGRIVPQAVIDLFPGGIINIHPSLLPKLRGSTPIESAILEGSAETGVSLMKLSEQMDAGPIYAQASLKLQGDETKQSLSEKLAALGAELIINNLPGILNGSLKAHSQDEKAASYTSKIVKNDGIIDWQKPAVIIERQIRAYAGWPGSRTKLFDKDVIITKARMVLGISEKPATVEVLADTGVIMVHASGGYICIDRLKPAGKSEMTAAEFIRGYYKA